MEIFQQNDVVWNKYVRYNFCFRENDTEYYYQNNKQYETSGFTEKPLQFLREV